MDFEETIGMYPHYYAFMRKLTVNAQQKREDRQIESQFGKVKTIDDLIPETEEEMIWRLEQVTKK